MDGLTTLQKCFVSAVKEREEASRHSASDAGASKSFRIARVPGVGVTEALLRLAVSERPSFGQGEPGLPTLVVVPHVSGAQARDSLRRLDPDGLCTFSVSGAQDLDRLAGLARARADSALRLVSVTDSFFRRLVVRLGDIRSGAGGGPLFKRAVFDDAWTLNIPNCPDACALAAWAVVGDSPVFSGAKMSNFLSRLLRAPDDELSGSVLCSESAVSTDPGAANELFSAHGGRASRSVDRRVVPWRPVSALDTARLVADRAGEDPVRSSGLVGCVATRLPGWRGWRDGDDRACPVCLAEPEDNGADEFLRARTRCCGKEFCAECISKALVFRAESGLPPSCPHCRDTLGACLEVCDPVVVRRTRDGQESRVGPGGVLKGIRSFEDAVREELEEALRQDDSRVLVVVPRQNMASILRTPWFLQTCVSLGAKGFGVMRGSCASVEKHLKMFEDGAVRVMVAEGGARKEFGVKMPGVTHVVMLDCFSRSSHWVSRTKASAVRAALSSRAPARNVRSALAVHKPVCVKRMVPAGCMFGRRVSSVARSP